MKKLRSNQDGAGHLIYILLIVIVVAVVAFVGWKVAGNKKTNNSSSKSSASTASTSSGSSKVTKDAVYTACMTKYNDKDLCKFQSVSAANPIDKMPYAATMTSTINGTTSTINFEQDGKGNNSLTTTGGDSSLQIDSVMYGGATYIKNGSVWMKYPAASSTAQTQDPSTNLSFLDSIANTQFIKIGKEACGSLTCIKYQIKDSTSPNATQYAWFDTKDYKMREFSSTDSTNGNLDMKITYQSVTISAPSPVQDYSTGQ